MEKIKIYNIKKFVENDNNEYTTHWDDDELAIIIGNPQVLIFYAEGVGYLKDNINELYEIGINDNDGKLYAINKYTTKYSILELLTAEYREDTIDNFIRMFGSRLEQNFNIMLDTINEIGLNSEDYFKRDGKFFDRRS